jgi:hypothetical protein
VARTWTVEYAPPSLYGFFRLESIAPLNGDAWAVGVASGPAMIATGGERPWDFISYPSSLLNMPLNDVKAFSPTNIWAVGSEGYRDYEMGHIARFDGQEWSCNARVSAVDGLNRLHGIDGRSPNDIWTVGAFAEQLWGAPLIPYVGPSHGPWKALTVHWDGSRWSRVDCDAKGDEAYLVDVTSLANGDAWAVGVWIDSVVKKTEALIMRWSRGGWEQLMAPTWRTAEADLWAVDSLAPDDVWAVGEIGYPSGRAMAIHWDGSSWSLTSVPSTQERSLLSGVACVAPGEVWAVGTQYEQGEQQPLIYHWDGRRWTEVAAPRKGGRHWLTDAALTDAGDVLVCGAFTDPAPYSYYTMPLVLRGSNT